MSVFAEFRDPPIHYGDFGSDTGGSQSLDGAPTDEFAEADVAEVLFYGAVGKDDWDGTEAAVIRLTDGRLVAWQTWWGPTGSGFMEDAYGGDAVLWFARPESLSLLVLQAMDDTGRGLCGIPKEGLTSATDDLWVVSEINPGSPGEEQG